jgi:hypothetical protein
VFYEEFLAGTIFSDARFVSLGMSFAYDLASLELKTQEVTQ